MIPPPIADLARQEQDVTSTDGGTPTGFREGGQVGVVRDIDRDVVAECRDERLAEVHVHPAEVRSHRDHPVGPPDDPDDRDADPDTASRGEPSSAARVSASPARSAAIWPTDGVARGSIDPHLVDDLATEADDGRRERVDLDVEGEDRRPDRVRPDDRGRPAGRAAQRCAFLGREAARDELADQSADRAPGESAPRDQLRTRHGAVRVELADDDAQVRSGEPSRSVVRARPAASTPVFCVPLFQMCVTDCAIRRRGVKKEKWKGWPRTRFAGGSCRRRISPAQSSSPGSAGQLAATIVRDRVTRR